MHDTNPTATEMHTEQLNKHDLEIQNLRQQNDKLTIEIQTLKATAPAGRWEGRISRFNPVVTALIGVAAFTFGVIQYIRAETASRKQRAEEQFKTLKADELARIEAKREALKPLWDKQIDLYMDAAETAATIALTDDEEVRTTSEKRFWILYWGPLAAIEDLTLALDSPPEIEQAMVSFGEACKKPFAQRDKNQMKQLSLKLAHAIRKALPKSFDVQAAELKHARPL